MRSVLLTFLLLGAAAQMRSSIITSTQCEVDGFVADGPYGCAVVSAAGSTAKAAIGTITEALSPNGFSINESVTVDTYSVGQMGDHGAGASASVKAWNALVTDGPERQGFIKFDWNYHGGGGYSEDFETTAKIGSFTNRQIGNGNLLGYCCRLLFPFDLGTSFEAELDVTDAQGVGEYDGTSGGSPISDLSFQLLEADGVTNVPIFEVDTPEPATACLFALAGAALVFRRRVRA